MSQPRPNEHAMASLLRSMQKHPLLDREQERALAEKVQKTQDQEALQSLVRANLRFVVKVAHSYRGYGLPLADLVQEGSIGLMMAVRKFDPTRGFRLISYAVWWVRAYMQNYIMHAWSLVKLGTTQAQRKLFFKLRGEQERLQRLNPSAGAALVEDIAQSLRVKPEEVWSMQARLNGRDDSLQAPVAQGRLQTKMEQLADTHEAASPEAAAGLKEEQQVVRRKVAQAMTHLNVKERYILQHRLMCHEPETLQQVGTYFQISRERARQIETNVLRKMKQALRSVVSVGHACRDLSMPQMA